MQINIQQGGIQEAEADAIIVNLFEGVTHPGGATGVVDKALDGAISDVIATGDLTGKLGETALLYPRGAIPAKRVIVVGLGKQDDFGLEAVREAAAVAIKRAQQANSAQVATIVHGGGIGGLHITEAAQAVVEGSMLALYQYDAPQSVNKSEITEVESLTVVEFDTAKLSNLEAGAQAGQVIAESVYLARDLANEPSNVITPTGMAEAALRMSDEVGLACKVLEADEMRDLGMNALLAVSQGATEPPKFIVMEHKPADIANPDAGPIVLIGKGVTFDTGGYSLKSGGGMVGMKVDMGGAAAVIGAMRAVAALKLKLHVVGLVGAVENMVSGTAYKPNDVFIAKNGLSIEVINTDAEGRLTLADALSYADDLNPSAVIDVATLTGGKVVALGKRMTALFANDDVLSESLLSAGQRVGEPTWRLPLDAAYDRQLKSSVADIKNTGGRAASAVTAARFLSYFVGEWSWANFDIAGSATYSDSADHTPRSYLTSGGTGIPLRTLVEFLRSGE